MVRKRPRIKTICADCLNILRGMRTSTVDTVLADPPYGISLRTRSGKRILNDERPFIWWIYDAFRVLKDGGTVLCFCRWDVARHFHWALQTAGFVVRSQVIWDRDIHGMGDTRSTFAPRYDTIWFATKGRFTFQTKRPVSVIRVRRLIHPTHPTEKPVALLTELLKAVAPPNGLVLDPFMGSGSTGEACQALGLRFIGIEKDDSFYRQAIKRLRRTSARSDQDAPVHSPAPKGSRTTRRKTHGLER